MFDFWFFMEFVTAVLIVIGVVTVIGADGFTINWTLGGANSAQFYYLCLP